MQRKQNFLIGAATALLTFGTLVSVFGFRHPMHHGYGHGRHPACHSSTENGCDRQPDSANPTEKTNSTNQSL
ncbi:MAG TPA: hypothetical protein PK509_12045 [Catalimonadaceae bacterium]|nr:hypothetical protein [Catalimonadaceae bacterium]HPI10425.1 hypothetical protein [Catalimonadaceae bacterium]